MAGFNEGPETAEIPDSLSNASGRSVDLRPVRHLLQRMITRWSPTAIWLFGSRARGDAQDLSDWDFLVVVPDTTAESELDPLVAWQMRKEAKVRADILPIHECDFHACRTVVGTLAYEVATDGIRIYGR